MPGSVSSPLEGISSWWRLQSVKVVFIAASDSQYSSEHTVWKQRSPSTEVCRSCCERRATMTGSSLFAGRGARLRAAARTGMLACGCTRQQQLSRPNSCHRHEGARHPGRRAATCKTGSMRNFGFVGAVALLNQQENSVGTCTCMMDFLHVRLPIALPGYSSTV